MKFEYLIIVACALNIMSALWLGKRNEEIYRTREEILVEKKKLIDEIEYMIDEVKKLK